MWEEMRETKRNKPQHSIILLLFPLMVKVILCSCILSFCLLYLWYCIYLIFVTYSYLIHFTTETRTSVAFASQVLPNRWEYISYIIIYDCTIMTSDQNAQHTISEVHICIYLLIRFYESTLNKNTIAYWNTYSIYRQGFVQLLCSSLVRKIELRSKAFSGFC